MTKTFRTVTALLAIFAALTVSQLSGAQRAFADDPPKDLCWTSALSTGEVPPAGSISLVVTLDSQEGPRGLIRTYKASVASTEVSTRNRTILVKGYADDDAGARTLNELIVRAFLALGQPREALLYLSSPVLQQYFRSLLTIRGLHIPPDAIFAKGFDPYYLRWQAEKLEEIRRSMQRPDPENYDPDSYLVQVTDPVLGDRWVKIPRALLPDRSAMNWVQDIYYYGPYKDMSDGEWDEYYYYLDWIDDIERITQSYYQSLPADERTKISVQSPFIKPSISLVPDFHQDTYDVIVLRDTEAGAYESVLTSKQTQNLLHSTNVSGRLTSVIELVHCPVVIDTTARNLPIGSIPGQAPVNAPIGGGGKD